MNQCDATELVNSLFESLGTFLLRYAYRKTGSCAAAEDAVQEAFLALYRDLRAGKTIQDPKSWTVGAVRNQTLKQARTRQRRREDLLPTDAFDLVAAQPDYADSLDEIDEMLPSSLALLTAREEEVILLRLQSFKYREIAEQLGIGTKSVCTLLARAISKLKKARQTPAGEQQDGYTERRKVCDALQ